jgi:hypothetical protein
MSDAPRSIREVGESIVDRLRALEQRISLLYAEAEYERARANLAEAMLVHARRRLEALEAQHRQRMSNVVPLRRELEPA